MNLRHFTVNTIRCLGRRGGYYAEVIDDNGETVHTTKRWSRVDTAHSAALLWTAAQRTHNTEEKETMGEATKTPVNSIEIPFDYVALCEGWYGGKHSMLYAISSTGGLTLGHNRPEGCESGSDEEWYLTLWRELSCDINRAVDAARIEHDDYTMLVAFENWVDDVAFRLAIEYGLENWDV